MSRRRVLRSLSAKLPKELKYPLMRRMIRVEQEIPKELSFRLARTRGELEAAYGILHDSYVDMKYSAPDASGLRLLKYFALPSTATLVALWDNEVVGTMSIIRSSPLGLPMEKSFDLSSYHQKGWQIAEVSSLAIHPEFRKSRGQVFLPLCKFFYDYVRFYMNLDAVVIAVNPSWSDFYEGLLMFEPLPSQVIENYGFANGAPAVGLIMNLQESETDFFRCYAHLAEPHDLHNYFVVKKAANAIFPTRPFAKSWDPVMSPEMLDYFFAQKSQVLKNLLPHEAWHLRAIYNTPPFKQILDAKLSKLTSTLALHPRFPVLVRGCVGDQNFTVLNVSRRGLLLKGSQLREGLGRITLQFSPVERCQLEVEPRWSDSQKSLIGLQVKSFDHKWERLIAFLENELNQVA